MDKPTHCLEPRGQYHQREPQQSDYFDKDIHDKQVCSRIPVALFLLGVNEFQFPIHDNIEDHQNEPPVDSDEESLNTEQENGGLVPSYLLTFSNCSQRLELACYV